MKRSYLPLLILLLPLLALVGCGGDSASEPVALSTQPPAATNTPEPPPTAEPTVAAIEFALSAAQAPVTVLLASGEQSSLQTAEVVNIQAADKISVGEGGRAVLRLGERLEVELFSGTDLLLDSATAEAGDSMVVRLNQVFGQTHTTVGDNARTRVVMTTDFSTLTSLVDGTEFIVCHDPSLLTCKDVLRGELEVEAQGKIRTISAEEATYTLLGEESQPPICQHTEEVGQWLIDLRAGETLPPLGALVDRWYGEPCPGAGQTNPYLPQSEGMVRIPSGRYLVGSTAGDDFHSLPQELSMYAFWIDAYEVTNGDYRAFVEASGHASPAAWAGNDDQPALGVTWEDAVAYCAWAKKSLPTEAQWEVAARGPEADPPLYPWGPDLAAGGQIDQLPRDSTYAVGSMAFNQSPFGVYDMAGNAWEWVGDPYAPVAENMKLLRGGRYGLIRDAAYRQQTEADNQRFVPVAGFRCAANQAEGG